MKDIESGALWAHIDAGKDLSDAEEFQSAYPNLCEQIVEAVKLSGCRDKAQTMVFVSLAVRLLSEANKPECLL
jgi:hypothetical protein